jgi:hypothetical protein
LCDLRQICGMVPKSYKDDDWGGGAREGYEDRGAFRQPRPRGKEPGSPLLRVMGGIAIVGGICWGVYLFTAAGGGMVALQQNNYGPIAIVGLGLICSVVGKYVRG